MEPVESTAVFDTPELPSVLNEILGVSETDLAVCYVLGKAEETTVKELAGQLDRDRSTISRSVSRLVERDLVVERFRIPESGGRVNVYSALPMEEIQRRLKQDLYAWVDAAVEQADDLDEAKMELLAERASEPVDDADGVGDALRQTDARGANPQGSEVDGAEPSLLDRILRRQRS